MKKLTQAELSEPDVLFIIRYDKWACIPQEGRDMLRAYIGQDTGKDFRFTLPAYLARQIEEMSTPTSDQAAGAVGHALR